MCFSPQRRAIFPHRNFKMWSAHEVFCTFWLKNVLFATAARNFSTSQLQKVVRACCVLYILTWKCASRYSGVQFFHIATSKSGPSMHVLLATAACNFTTSQLQKVVRACCVLYILTWKCASRCSGAQFFISELNSYPRTRRFNEVTFRPSRHTNHWKNTTFRDFPNISRNCSFFLLTLLFFSAFFIFWLCYSTLLFQLSILSEVRLLNFLR